MVVKRKKKILHGFKQNEKKNNGKKMSKFLRHFGVCQFRCRQNLNSKFIFLKKFPTKMRRLKNVSEIDQTFILS